MVFSLEYNMVICKFYFSLSLTVITYDPFLTERFRVCGASVVLKDLIPDLISSQKCHMKIGLKA
jgi:hypothetical protein